MNTPLQQAFDTMVARLYDGRGRAFNEDDGHCEYETQDGVPCVVGCILPDNHPAKNRSNSTGIGVRTLIRKYPDETPDVVIGNRLLMTEMQCIHDPKENWHGNMPAPDVLNRLTILAENHGLSLNMPT